MDKQTIIETLADNGGNRWTKNGKDRVYFDTNTIAKIGGLEFGTYNTGNISWATLNGSDISNSHAKKIMVSLTDSKVFFDLTNNTWNMLISRNYVNEEAKSIIHTFVEIMKQKLA